MGRLALSLAAAAAAGGAAWLGYALNGDDAQVDRDRARIASLVRQRDRAAAERDRVRAERDSLEGRLAADRSAPVCPERSVRIADAGISAPFTVDYPCGWHVVWEPGVRSAEYPGRLVDTLVVARLPINRSPRGLPLGDIELEDWRDDDTDDADALPSRDAFVAAERAAFLEPPRESVVRTEAGVRIVGFSGKIADLEDRPVPASMYLWEYFDAETGARHLVRALAVHPGPQVRAEMERLARSFRVLVV